MEEAGRGRKYECWFEQGRCVLLIKVDGCINPFANRLGVNLINLICWGYHLILGIDLSLSDVSTKQQSAFLVCVLIFHMTVSTGRLLVDFFHLISTRWLAHFA